ncbi:MAG TPA: hypothetical protein VMT03_26315 [Polyangia bacterium]|nr:hypothetical protein [Polyangia bacterium]
MTLIRACFLLLAITLPASWTIARAADEPPAGDSGGDMKKSSKKKSKKKDKGADSGGDMDKK